MKKKNLIIITFLVFAIAFGLIYYNMNILKNTENTYVLASRLDEKILNEADINIESENLETTVLPDNSEVNTPATFIERKLAVFIDKNNNGIKEEDEVECTQCSGEQVIITNIDNENVFPDISKLKAMPLGKSGVINESALSGLNTVWASMEGKNLLIPLSAINLGDGVDDAMVPAISFSFKLAGVNSNIIASQDETSKEYTVYSFVKLIPVMQTSSEKGNPIYVKFVSPNDTGKYYLGKGFISKEGEDYKLKIKWNLQDCFNNQIINPANLTFYVI
jgi:hypothetical protein